MFANLFGASSFAQKYCPPALGRAEANSLKLIPTQVEIKATKMTMDLVLKSVYIIYMLRRCTRRTAVYDE